MLATQNDFHLKNHNEIARYNKDSGKYLTGLTKEEWINLDIDHFLYFGCSHLIVKQKRFHSGDLVEFDDILNSFFIIGKQYLGNLIKKHPDINPKERPRLVFATLRNLISFKVKPEINNQVSLYSQKKDYSDPHSLFTNVDLSYFESDENEIIHNHIAHAGDQAPIEVSSYCPDICESQVSQSYTLEERAHLLSLLEQLREKFTQMQYRIMFRLFINKDNPSMICHELDIKRSNYCNCIRTIKNKLIKLLPEEHYSLVEDLITS